MNFVWGWYVQKLSVWRPVTEDLSMSPPCVFSKAKNANLDESIGEGVSHLSIQTEVLCSSHYRDDKVGRTGLHDVPEHLHKFQTGIHTVFVTQTQVLKIQQWVGKWSSSGDSSIKMQNASTSNSSPVMEHYSIIHTKTTWFKGAT